MKNNHFILALLLVTTTTLWAGDIQPSVNLATYYASIDGKSNNTLRTTLEGIIGKHTVVSYDNLKYLLKYADTENADGTNLIDIYSQCTFTISGEQITWLGSASEVGLGINREHTVPQSWFEKKSPMVSDAFHIYATDVVSNGHRSSYYYGECLSGTSKTGTKCNESGKLGTSTFSGYTSTVYEPADEFKGDIARGFFYMATCYADSCSDWGRMFGSDNNGLTNYTVALMLKWHRQDPVSKKELIRNEVIYGNSTYNKSSYKQNNRNPFIDYPDLVEYIWGNKKSTNVNLSSLQSAYELDSNPDAILTLSENGVSSNYDTVKLGQSISLPDCEVYCDKVFMGWSEKNTNITASDIMAVDSLYTMNATAVTLYAVFATETSGTVTWNKVSSVSVGQYVIINNSKYLPNAVSTSSGPTQETAPAITNNMIADKDVTAAMKWNLTDAGSGRFYVKNAAGNYLYETNSNNGIRVGSTSDSWTFVANDTALAMKGSNNNRYCATYSAGSDWRSYTSMSHTNYNDGGKLYLYKRTTGTPTYSDYSVTCSAKTNAPILSLKTGEYTTAQTLTITADEGTIYYTDDDSDPTTSSTRKTYTSPIQLNTWCVKTIKVVAIAKGKSASDIVSAIYTINLPFASLQELVATDVPSGTTITVSFSNIPIKSFVTNKSSRVGVYFDIQKEGKDIEIYCKNVPESWVVGGKLSFTNLTCAWQRYPATGNLNCWELTPSSWDGFTYTDPVHISSIVISGSLEKKVYSEGQTLNSAGLVVTGYYSDHTASAPHSEELTEGLTWNLPTLSEGQTSAEITVEYTEPVLSQLLTGTYTATGLTVSAAKTLQSIYVAEDSKHQTNFFVGRPFSATGLKVMARYNSGSDEPITPAAVTPATMTSEGNQTVTISYSENEITKQTSYTITLTYMNLNDLVTATDIQKDEFVYVAFDSAVITDFYTNGAGKRFGIYLDVEKAGGPIEIYCSASELDSTWVKGGDVKAKLDSVKWTEYKGTWELCPASWDLITYHAPRIPFIELNPTSIDFGIVEKGAVIPSDTVLVALSNIGTATVSVTGSVFSVDKTQLTESGKIIISASSTTIGSFSEILTVEAEGAEPKAVSISLVVDSPTSFRDIQDDSQVRKTIMDNRVIIIRGDQRYDILGAPVQ